MSNLEASLIFGVALPSVPVTMTRSIFISSISMQSMGHAFSHSRQAMQMSRSTHRKPR